MRMLKLKENREEAGGVNSAITVSCHIPSEKGRKENENSNISKYHKA